MEANTGTITKLPHTSQFQFEQSRTAVKTRKFLSGFYHAPVQLRTNVTGAAESYLNT